MPKLLAAKRAKSSFTAVGLVCGGRSAFTAGCVLMKCPKLVAWLLRAEGIDELLGGTAIAITCIQRYKMKPQRNKKQKFSGDVFYRMTFLALQQRFLPLPFCTGVMTSGLGDSFRAHNVRAASSMSVRLPSLLTASFSPCVEIRDKNCHVEFELKETYTSLFFNEKSIHKFATPKNVAKEHFGFH